MVLTRVNAIKKWREVIGPTNPDQAREIAPNSLRALYGSKKNTTFNGTHGSDSPESAAREIKFFFPQNPVFPLPSMEQSRDYVSATLVPVLTEGLTKLCKQKPKDPILWLADWLLENNPNKPKVTIP